MGLEPGDLSKVPGGMSIKECYKRISKWYGGHRGAIVSKLHRSASDPHVACFSELVAHLPPPAVATDEDVALVCVEVVCGLMEWAYHEKDSNGVKMAAYAHYVLDNFFDGFHGDKTKSAVANSALMPFSMRSCLDRKNSSSGAS